MSWSGVQLGRQAPRSPCSYLLPNFVLLCPAVPLEDLFAHTLGRHISYAHRDANDRLVRLVVDEMGLFEHLAALRQTILFEHVRCGSE